METASRGGSEPAELRQGAWYLEEFDAALLVMCVGGEVFVPLAALCDLLGLPLRPYIAAARHRYAADPHWLFRQGREVPDLTILPVRRGDMMTDEWCLHASRVRAWFPARVNPREFHLVAPDRQNPLLRLCRRLAYAFVALEREKTVWRLEAESAGRDALHWCMERRTLHERWARKCAATRARAAVGVGVRDRAPADAPDRLRAEGDRIVIDLFGAAWRLRGGDLVDPRRVEVYLLQVLFAGPSDTGAAATTGGGDAPAWPLVAPLAWLRPHLDAYQAWLGRLRTRALADGLPWPLEAGVGVPRAFPGPGPRPAS